MACSSPHAAGRRAQKRSRNADGSTRLGGEGLRQQHDSDLGVCARLLALPAVDPACVGSTGLPQQQAPALLAGLLTAEGMASLLGGDWLERGNPVLPTQHCTTAACGSPPLPPWLRPSSASALDSPCLRSSPSSALLQKQPDQGPDQRAQQQEQVNDISCPLQWPGSDEDGPQAAELHLGSESHAQHRWQRRQHSTDLIHDLLADVAPMSTWTTLEGVAGYSSLLPKVTDSLVSLITKLMGA